VSPAWANCTRPGNTSGKLVTPVAAVEYCAEYLLGKDPTEIERHWQHMFRRNIFRGGADSMAAIGAIDMALWDITGKLAGLPVHKLLGGPTREKVRAYTHLNMLSPEQAADEARRRVEEGFTAIRMYPLGDRKDFAQLGYAGIVRRAEKYVSAVRNAVGPDIDIMIDVVCLLTPPEAIELGRALQPYRSIFSRIPSSRTTSRRWHTSRPICRCRWPRAKGFTRFTSFAKC